MTREVYAPRGRYAGRSKVYSTNKRQWDKLSEAKPGPMRTCYSELADRPFPPRPLPRHHRLKGKLKDFWEYEVGGGERVRYKRESAPNGRPGRGGVTGIGRSRTTIVWPNQADIAPETLYEHTQRRAAATA